MKRKPFTYQFGGMPQRMAGSISEKGYRRDSPERFNAFNIIPSNNITMRNVPHRVLGIDDTGASKLMYPGHNYVFPGSVVLELPFLRYGGKYLQQGGTPASLALSALGGTFAPFEEGYGDAMDAGNTGNPVNSGNPGNTGNAVPASPVTPAKPAIKKRKFVKDGRDKWNEYLDLPVVTDGNKKLRDILYKVARDTNVPPEVLFASSMEEGLQLNRKGNKMVFEEDDNGKFVDGFVSLGLDNFSDRVGEFNKKGYLKKPIEYYEMNNVNELGNKVNSAGFDTLEDGLYAKAAYLLNQMDVARRFAKNHNLNLSNDALNFFAMQSYNGGDGILQKAYDKYKAQGLLNGEKFLQQEPAGGYSQNPSYYNTRKRYDNAKHLIDIGAFNDYYQRQTGGEITEITKWGPNIPAAQALVSGMSLVGNLLQTRNQNKQNQEWQRVRGLGDALGIVMPASRGDFTADGYFRPDQNTPVQFGAVPVPMAQLGGGFFSEPLKAPASNMPPDFFSLPAAAPQSQPNSGNTQMRQGYKPANTTGTTIKQEPNENAWNAFDYYINKKKIQPHIAAGIVGNLYRESEVNPRALEKENTAEGMGIIQWNRYNRGKAMKQWAEKRGRDPYNLYTQLDYILEEPGESNKVFKALEDADTPERAAWTFGKVYARPRDQKELPANKNSARWDIREGIARKLYDRYMQTQEVAGDADESENTSLAMGGQAGYGLQTGAEKRMDRPAFSNANDEVRSSLEPIDRWNANIEAERGETVWGDFNKDGVDEHYRINGKKHAKGGTPLNVPGGSFIFSDDRKLKIGGSVLQQFGKSANTKKKYTPAQLAGQYDLNTYRAMLRNPDIDKLQLDTATLMLANNQEKLAKLALLQESIKGFPDGIPSIAMPLLEQSSLPQAQKGGTAGTKKQTTGVSVYGGDKNNPRSYQSGTLNLGKGFNKYDAGWLEQKGYTNSPEGLAEAIVDAGYEGDLNDIKGIQKFLIQKNLQQGNLALFDDLLKKYGMTNQGIKAGYGEDWDTFELDPDMNEAVWVKELMEKVYADGMFGVRSGDMLKALARRKMKPSIVASIPKTTYEKPKITVPDKIKIKEKMKPNDFNPVPENEDGLRFWPQDIINAGTALMNLNNIRKYPPLYAGMNVVLPQLVFEDPARQLGAAQQQVNANMNAAALMSNPQIARAMAASNYGKLADAAANIIAQTNNRNVQIANQQEAMDNTVINNANLQNANARLDYWKGNTIMNQNYDNARKAAMAALVPNITGALDNAMTALWQRRLNDQYAIDPETGRLYFKNGKSLQEQRVWQPTSRG